MAHAPDLARTLLDPGLFSDNTERMSHFYIHEVGLPLLERLPHSDTYAEVFFTLPPGKLKIQSSTLPMEPADSGYAGLIIAQHERREATSLVDPDGLPVQLVPVGHRGVTIAGYVVRVPDVERQRRFYIDGMGAIDTGDGLRVGETMLFVEHAPGKARSSPAWRRGFTYITLIVHDAVATHEALLSAEAEHSLRLLRLDDRCLFSWVRDPFGNWIEMVQYAELSGPLPDIGRLAQHWDEVTKWRETGEAF